jgi:hypothetical protein
MAIYRILRNSTFGPQEISTMTTAYEVALIELGIDRTDPRTEIIASAMVHRAGTDAKDVRALGDFAIRQIKAKAADEARPMPVTPDFSAPYSQKRHHSAAGQGIAGRRIRDGVA